MVYNVIIADDHQTWRETQAGEIQDTFPDVRVDMVETREELVNRVLSGDYSVVVSDNDMENQNDGLEALRTIRKAGNNVPFYLWSARNIGDEALSSGANGFYKKDLFATEFEKMVTEIAQYLE